VGENNYPTKAQNPQKNKSIKQKNFVNLVVYWEKIIIPQRHKIHKENKKN
jgi:hypothetical protein